MSQAKVDPFFFGVLPSDFKVAGTMLQDMKRSESVPDLYLASCLFNNYPSHTEFRLEENEFLAVRHFMKMIKEDYGHNEKNDIFVKSYNSKLDYFYTNQALVKLSDDLALCLKRGGMTNTVEANQEIAYDIDNFYETARLFAIYYLPQSAAKFKVLIEKIKKCLLRSSPERALNVVCKNDDEFYLTEVQIKKPKINDLALHYGDEFLATHKKIINGLEKKEGSGIVLLHGEPGTGKTHYIRYLIQEIKDKKLIYIPPDMAEKITSPDFLPFMLENGDSILIIEDAENIIQDRIESGMKHQAVANILNLSDGLLGDSLHQPIIATFNCELSKIDAALLRNGRLIANHEFKKLSADRAQKLSNELGFKAEISEAMSLAEIYGQ